MTALTPPTSVTECLSLNRVFNFYRWYVEAFSSIGQPITDLMKKGVVWGTDTWTPKHEAALQALKDDLGTPGKGLNKLDPSLQTLD
jgi:hypothetical protein